MIGRVNGRNNLGKGNTYISAMSIEIDKFAIQTVGTMINRQNESMRLSTPLSSCHKRRID